MQNSFSLTETLLGKYLLHSLFKKYHTYSLFIEIKEIMVQWFKSFWDKKFLELHFFSEISLLCILCHIYPHEPSYHFTLTKQYLVTISIIKSFLWFISEVFSCKKNWKKWPQLEIIGIWSVGLNLTSLDYR